MLVHKLELNILRNVHKCLVGFCKSTIIAHRCYLIRIHNSKHLCVIRVTVNQTKHTIFYMNFY